MHMWDQELLPAPAPLTPKVVLEREAAQKTKTDDHEVESLEFQYHIERSNLVSQVFLSLGNTISDTPTVTE